MAYNMNEYVDCETIQGLLNEYFIKGDASFNDLDNPGFLQFITSPTNVGGFLQQQISPGGGKLRQVRATYQPRLPESEVSETVTHGCTAENNYGESSVTYSMTHTDGVSFNDTLTITELIENCKDNNWWLMRKIARGINVLDRKLDTKILTQATALVGAFAQGEADVTNDIKVVQTRKSDGTFTDDMLQEVKFALMNAGYTNRHIFGWNETYKYFDKALSGCCGSEGIDYGDVLRRFGVTFTPDPRVETIFGTRHFFAAEAGALQLLTFNLYAGPRGINSIQTEAYTKTVIYSPNTGIPYDISIVDNCGVWSIVIEVAAKLVGLPDDIYFTGDRKEGVTFVNEFFIQNP